MGVGLEEDVPVGVGVAVELPVGVGVAVDIVKDKVQALVGDTVSALGLLLGTFGATVVSLN